MGLATREYIVKPGDSLSAISLRECHSSIWSTLATLNHLQAPYRICAGQKLQLPAGSGGSASVSGASRPRESASQVKAPAMEFPIKHKVWRIPLIVGTLTLEIEGKVEITSLKNDPEITVDPKGKIEWARKYATCLRGFFGTLGFSLDTKR